MLLESDEYVNESNLSDSFHRTDPLCELDLKNLFGWQEGWWESQGHAVKSERDSNSDV